MPQAIISTISHDRPGLVQSLTEVVHELGLNIEDSRMAVMGTEFVTMMAIGGDDQSLSLLNDRLTALTSAKEITYSYRRTQSRPATQKALPYRVSVYAMDHPGIVYTVATFFSARSINIADLRTDTQPAPHTGTPVFNLKLTIEVPADVRVQALRQDFEGYCEDKGLDGEIEAGLGRD